MVSITHGEHITMTDMADNGGLCSLLPGICEPALISLRAKGWINDDKLPWHNPSLNETGMAMFRQIGPVAPMNSLRQRTYFHEWNEFGLALKDGRLDEAIGWASR